MKPLVFLLLPAVLLCYIPIKVPEESYKTEIFMKPTSDRTLFGDDSNVTPWVRQSRFAIRESFRRAKKNTRLGDLFDVDAEVPLKG